MKVVIVGGVAGGASAAARIRRLAQYGFTCAHLSGGYRFYQVVTQERQTAQSAYPCGDR